MAVKPYHYVDVRQPAGGEHARITARRFTDTVERAVNTFIDVDNVLVTVRKDIAGTVVPIAPAAAFYPVFVRLLAEQITEELWKEMKISENGG